MTYNELAELFKREGGDAQVCFSVISQNQILFGNNDTKKDIISFQNEEPIKWLKKVQEESISEDLEKAASQYPSVIRTISPQWESELENDFKAGALWQRKQIIQ